MSMQFCEQCGAKLREGAAFCESCGAPVAMAATTTTTRRLCPSCGAEVPADGKFCEVCGTPVGGAAPAAPATPSFCEQCGSKLSAGQRVCQTCGAPVQAPAPAAPAGAYAAAAPASPAKKPGFFKRFFHRSEEPGMHTADTQAAATPVPPGPDERPCPKCGAPVKSWQRSCQQCGYVLDAVGNTDPSLGGSAGFKPVTPSAGASAGAHSAPGQAVGTAYSPPMPDVADESDTSVLLEDEPDDYPTMVQPDGSTVYVTRLSSGARIDMTLPATMGKGSQASCLIAGNTAISRTHVRITCDALGYQLEDLASTNGTTVDGVKLPKGGTASLADGTVFALADEEFVFHTM